MRFPPAMAWTLVCACVTAGIVLGTGLNLMDLDWGVSGTPMLIAMGLAAALTAVLAVLSVAFYGLARWRRGIRSPHAFWPHALVPMVLVVVIPFGVEAGGPVRDRWETSLLWAAVAAATHVLLGLALLRRLPGLVRVAAVAAIVGAVVGAVDVERVSQFRWRTKDFRALEVPLVVPEIPGLTLVRAYPDRHGPHDLFLLLSDQPDRPTFHPVYVTVERSQLGDWSDSRACWRRAEDRFVFDPSDEDSALVFCLDDGKFRMIVWAYPAVPNPVRLPPLLDRITLRPMSASELARYPGTRGDARDLQVD